MKDLNQLAAHVHSLNKRWWTDLTTGEPIERNREELLALVISELSEALEGERKNLMDDKLPHRKMAEVEMADAYIRLLDYAGGYAVPLINMSDYTLTKRLSDNKAAALFRIMTRVTKSKDSYHLNWSLYLIEAYCTKHGYDLDGAIAEKLVYNQTREDHTTEARLGPNGKKF